MNRPLQRQQDAINCRRVLLIDRVECKDGWSHGGMPSEQPQKAPVTGSMLALQP